MVRRGRRSRKRKGLGAAGTLLMVFLVVLGAAGAAAWLVFAPSGPDSEMFVELRPGSSTVYISQQLESAGVVRSRFAFLLVRWLKRGSLRAGEYRFDHPAAVTEVYARIARGDVYTKTVIVPEGASIFDIAARLEQAGFGTRQEFLNEQARQAALVADFDPQARSLEGYLFPDTYRFARKATLAQIAATMVRRCHELDPTRAVSAAVNGSNEKGVSDAFDVIGFNYALQLPDAYHKEHPKRPLYGSETSSALSTRGVYATDPLRNTVNSYDSAARWGETAEEWWKFYGTREWEAGGFAWTGFDYRGEPTPYGWPSINSQFGIVDMCGFPKDAFYYYKAWWRTEPSLHLFPHWNFEGREGEMIPVWVFSNLDEVELFVNGQSQGSQKVPRLGHVEWKVRYEPGFIEARGSKDGKVVLTEKRETAGATVAIRLTADRAEIDADGEDIAILKVEALDKEGRPVPTANNLIGFKVSGAGALIGVGNGDPNCQESDKEPRRSLFNGLAQVIVQSTKRPGEIHIEAAKEGWDGPELTGAKLAITTKKAAPRPAVG